MRVRFTALTVAVFLSTFGELWAAEPKVSDERASAAFLAGDYDEAIRLYDEVIRANPKSALAYNGRGLAHRERKDYAKALSDLDQAVRLAPSFIFLFNRGATYYLLDNTKSAIADLTRALKTNPGDRQGRADCLAMRARCYISEKNADAALADLNSAIKANPKHADSYFLRGIVHKVLHKYDRSLADYEKAIGLDPNLADAYMAEAYLLSVCPVPRYRDGVKAVRYATKACELTQWNRAQFIEALAAAYAETGDFEQAIRFEKRAGEIDKEWDGSSLVLYEQHHPRRDLNRAEKAVPLPAKDCVSITLSEKLVVHFDVDGGQLINARAAKGDRLEGKGFKLDFGLHKRQRILFLEHTFDEIVRVRCLARLEGQDAYFETDLLPIPPQSINPESWSEEIEELVLFDFHFAGDERVERGVSQL